MWVELTFMRRRSGGDLHFCILIVGQGKSEYLLESLNLEFGIWNLRVQVVSRLRVRAMRRSSAVFVEYYCLSLVDLQQRGWYRLSLYHDVRLR